MDATNSLINLGELSKPATVLIEKISSAVGTIFEPHQIRRVAHAEADAAIIAANTRVQISEIERRGLVRMVRTEGKRQENIEAISTEAIKALPPEAKPEELEDEWLNNFFEKCKDVSDKEMQALWSRILMGEATAVGTYSKQTVQLLSTLAKKDAELFTNLCGFALNFGTPTPLIFNFEDRFYGELGIAFEDLTHLDSLGLIRLEPMGFLLIYTTPRVLVVFGDQQLILELTPSTNLRLPTGQVKFSQSGRELAKICKPKPLAVFQEYVITEWGKRGVYSSCPWPRVAVD